MFDDSRTGGHAPMFNVPGIVLLLIAALAIIHFAVNYVDPNTGERIILTLAFIPARYDLPLDLLGNAIPGGAGAKYWSFVTHMFLHGDWMHLGFNALWMLAFGSVVARRLGPFRFLILSCLCAAAGALAYLLMHWGQVAVLVGASGAISGQMAGAVRLMFSGGRSLSTVHTRDLEHSRPLSLAETFTTPRPLLFLAVWFGITLLTGFSSFGVPGETVRIAWEAHVGGFLGGLLVFGWLDPARGDHPEP
ncbi:MAG: rhomboid family intramembrane serine protease [Parvibaculaceae bacterium]